MLEKIGLKLSYKKTKITNINEDKALFLGTLITRGRHTKYVKLKKTQGSKRNPRRLRLEAPIARIQRKLTEAGFKSEGKPHPKFVWMGLEHKQIIDRYNAVLRGYLNYYSFAHNYGEMAATTEFTLKQSCAKLLAAKFTLKTMSKVFQKFGPNLQAPTTEGNGAQFLKPSYKITLKFKTRENPDGKIQALYSSKSLATLDKKKCSVCESGYRVEMHHIRAMKNLNPKLSIVDKIMAKQRRKQIPLCRKLPPHMEKHRGNL